MNTPRLIMDPAKLLLLGGCLLPVLVVQAVRSLSSTPLTPASAATSEGPAEPEPTPSPSKESPATLNAALWLSTRKPATIAACPMDKPAAIAETQATSQPEPEIEPVVNQPGVPSLRVTSIVGTVDRAVAMINSKVRSVGESPSEGWIITHIDAGQQSVTLIGPAGQVLTLHPPKR